MAALPAVHEFIETSLPFNKRFDMTLEAENEVEGRLICHGPACLSGKVTGSIEAHELLVIEKSAIIEANITASKIVIHGQVMGKITASEGVYLSSSATFVGELHAPSIELDEGARFEGSSTMTTHLREADPDQDDEITSPVHLLHENLEGAL